MTWVCGADVAFALQVAAIVLQELLAAAKQESSTFEV
jgi:hypothetical protein